LTKRFNEILLGSIDRTLTKILGEESKRDIYIYLKVAVFLEREDIGRKLDAFQAGLEMLFGLGAAVIEYAIVKELFSEMGLNLSGRDTFVNLVEKARTYFTLYKKKIK